MIRDTDRLCQPALYERQALIACFEFISLDTNKLREFTFKLIDFQAVPRIFKQLELFISTFLIIAKL